MDGIEWKCPVNGSEQLMGFNGIKLDLMGFSGYEWNIIGI